MQRACSTVAVALLGLAIPSVAAEKDSSGVETPPAPDIVQTSDDRFNRMTVPVTIGEKGTYRFMVDTGAQATVITHQLNERLQLNPTGRALIVGMASSKWADTVELDEISLGDRTFF